MHLDSSLLTLDLDQAADDRADFQVIAKALQSSLLQCNHELVRTQRACRAVQELLTDLRVEAEEQRARANAAEQELRTLRERTRLLD